MMKVIVSACLAGDNCKYNGGTFSGTKIPGRGLFAELCIKAGYKVLDIEEI